MLPDDIFRARLQSTVTALRYWAPSIADSAHVEETETGDFWRVAVAPAVASACPFTLVLYTDQRYDVSIAGETYEGRPIETFDWFLPFAEGVAAGRVVQRQRVSRLTGLERSMETLVSLHNGDVWSEGRGALQRTPSIEDDGTELYERRFLPYRR